MEIYYLANQEKNLYFALLGDFTDSKTEHAGSDESIAEEALRDIEILNDKYSKQGENIFYFCAGKGSITNQKTSGLAGKEKEARSRNLTPCSAAARTPAIKS